MVPLPAEIATYQLTTTSVIFKIIYDLHSVGKE